MSTHRHWCFTLNNPQGDEIQPHIWGARYCIWQLEVGERGTLHFQGYIEFYRSVRLSWCKALLPRAHWEPRRGTRQEARDYCKKDNCRIDGPWEWGNFREGGQGARNDLLQIQEELDRGDSIRDIAKRHFGTFVRYHRGIERYISLQSRVRSWVTKAICIFGPPGIGKTWLASQFDDTAYWYTKSYTGEWWDGYNGEPTIICDEFNKPYFTLNLFNRLVGQYTPAQVDTKGGRIQFLGKRMIFTTNTLPHLWYDWDRLKTPKETVLRRFNKFLCVFDKINNNIGLIVAENYLDFISAIRDLIPTSNNTFFKNLNLQWGEGYKENPVIKAVSYNLESGDCERIDQ